MYGTILELGSRTDKEIVRKNMQGNSSYDTLLQICY